MLIMGQELGIRFLYALKKHGFRNILVAQTIETLLYQVASIMTNLEGKKATVEAVHKHEGPLGKTEIKISNTTRSRLGCLVLVGLGALSLVGTALLP